MLRSGLLRPAVITVLGSALLVGACSSGGETLTEPEVYDPTDLKAVALRAYTGPEQLWEVMTPQCQQEVALTAGGYSDFVATWQQQAPEIEVIGTNDSTGAVTYVWDGAEQSAVFVRGEGEDENWYLDCGPDTRP